VGLFSPGRGPGYSRELVERAKRGEAEARDALLRGMSPFVLKVASQATGRYLRADRDDEVSIALMAFNQAIDGYQAERGSFLAFAETVIRRRLIDYQRRQRTEREVPWSALEVLDDEGDPAAPILDQVAKTRWAIAESDRERHLEVEDYRQELERYGLRLEDVADACPRHRDARDRALAVARRIAADPDLRRFLAERRTLPIKRLEDLGIERRKNLERHRRYIVAAALIFMHAADWPHLAGYVGAPAAGEG
jgi:RNA polymerase sigma factor